MKNKFIIVMTVILLITTGYLTYDKFVIQKNKKLSEHENSIKNTKEKNNNIIEETCPKTNTIDELIGSWNYEETFKSGEIDCTATIKLELKEDGTFNYENGSTCSGGTNAQGKYSIFKNKLYLNNESCKPVADISNEANQCIYPNCQSLIELTVEDNIISAPRIGGTQVKLTHSN